MDVEALTADQLESELCRLERVRTQAAAVQVALVAEADRRQLPTWDGARTMAEWVAARLDVSSETARAYVDLSRRLPQLPVLEKRLLAGELGMERVSALAPVSTPATESDLIDIARGFDIAGVRRLATHHRTPTTADERRAHHDSYVIVQPSLDRSWWQLRGGLSGPAGAIVDQALTERAHQLPAETGTTTHRHALALEAICTDDLDRPLPDNTHRRRPTITAFVDLDHPHDNTGNGDNDGGIADIASAEIASAEIAAGPPIGTETLTELACTGTIRVVGLSDGKPVITTDATSPIPPVVRHFVLHRDGACRAPGCTSRHRLQPHHIIPRSHRGTHHPDNLLTLCWYHHHIVIHRRGHQIETGADGTIRFLLPQDTRAPP